MATSQETADKLLAADQEKRAAARRDALPHLIVTRGDGVALPDQPAAVAAFIDQATRRQPEPETAPQSSLGRVVRAPGYDDVPRMVREALRRAADLAFERRDAPGSIGLRLASERADDQTLRDLRAYLR